MSKVTFIVAEPSYIIRKGLVNLINELPNTIVVRELENAQKITDSVNYYRADALVINLDLIDKLGQSELNSLKNIKDKLSVVVVSNSDLTAASKHNDLVSREIQISESKSSVLKKIREVIGLRETQDANPENSELSEREIEILKNVALGLSNKEIAEKNFISPHTVITHRKNITRKLGIKTVSGLTIYAILNKIIGMEALE